MENCTGKEMEITRVMDQLSRQVESLSDAVNRIGDRISIVMSSPLPNKLVDGEKKELLTPLGSQIDKQIEAIHTQTSILNDYINRLEI